MKCLTLIGFDSKTCKSVKSLQELIRLARFDLIFHCNQHGSLTRVNLSDQERLAPVIPSSQIHRRIGQGGNQDQYWTKGGANRRRNQRKVRTVPASDISPKGAAGCPRSHVDEHE